jgi:hypothetical protein
VDEASAGAFRFSMVVDPHPVDELGLAGEVHVVGPGGGAGGDDRPAVEGVGADGGDHEPGRLGDPRQRGDVSGVGLEEAGRRRPGRGRREPRANRLQLVPIPPDQRPAQPLGRVRREVGGGQAAGEPGRAEQRQVVLPLGRHAGIVAKAG